MTKSTITREESIQAVFDLKVGYTLGLADIEILKRVARMALAAMDSEPMAESEQLAIKNFRSAMEGIGHIRRTLEETFGGLHGTHVEPDVLAECKAICDAIYAAYRHAQPAPVVPDAYVRDEHGRMMINGVCEPKIGFGTGWNACRAAMLSAAPHDTPALNSVQSVDSVADRWIPVSERMPVQIQPNRYIPLNLLLNERTVVQGGFDDGAFWVDGCEVNNCTRWQPLPEPPQEVKGE